MFKLPLFFFFLFFVASLISRANTFTSRQPSFGFSRSSSSSSSSLLFANAANKYFQLEEAEDRETSTTELFLKEDNSVLVGQSDGPLPLDTFGSWSTEDGSFQMTITRIFQAGKKETTFTDMGEFTFKVERLFTGEISTVGSHIAMTGSIRDRDELFGDRQVGFFSMIDTTDAKLGTNDEQSEKKGRTQTS